MNSLIKPNSTFEHDVKILTKKPEDNKNHSVDSQVPEQKIGEVKESAYSINKKQLNAAILESSLEFTATASNQPQSLVLKTVLQGINEALQEIGLNNNIEDAYESRVDFSPEATAERIVSFSTQLFASYREQNPSMGEEELLTTFAETIGAGIEQGFNEAKDILGSLNVLEGDITKNIDKTYDLVQVGLKSFVDEFSKDKEEK